ncbi:uncharacterized protein RHO17_025604 [Thomomys bottae]
MSDNFHSSSFLGAAHAPQLPLPVVSEASSLTGTACSFSRVQAPALTSAWPLPSTSATSFQTLMGGAYLCQYSSTTLWAGGAAHSQISTSAASYSSVWEWDMGGDNMVTITDQGAVISSSVLTCQYTTCAHGNALVPPYPSLPASLVQETPAHIVNQGYILPLPCWEGNQGYCYDPHSLGLLFSGELGPCLQSHGSMSSMGSTALNPQSERVLVLKDAQPPAVSPPVSSQGMSYSVSAEAIAESSAPDFDKSIVDTTLQNMENINKTLMQEKSSVTDYPTVQVAKNKREAFEVTDEASKAKLQRQNPECPEEKAGDFTVAANDRALVNIIKYSSSKAPNVTSSRARKNKSHGQESRKNMRENNPENGGARTHSGNKKKINTKEKSKRSYPESSREALKRPRSNLAIHMMESVKVFHALGKKNERKTQLSSSKALGNASNYKDSKFSSAIQSRIDATRVCKSPKKTLARKEKRSAENQYPSACQGELPPPGKVRLVPLPFLSPQKPRVRPLSRRPQSLASHRPTVADPAQFPSNTAQPTPLNASQPAHDSSCLRAPIKPPQPISTHATLWGRNNPPQSSVSQLAVARPAPHKPSPFTALQHKPVSTAATKRRSPPKPPNQYLLQDFSFQPIPWRKPDIPGPAVSDPISKEQRPEREAMKRRAQQEREKAAQNTFVGQLPFFHQRQTDMEISQYYGYATLSTNDQVISEYPCLGRKMRYLNYTSNTQGHIILLVSEIQQALGVPGYEALRDHQCSRIWELQNYQGKGRISAMMILDTMLEMNFPSGEWESAEKEGRNNFHSSSFLGAAHAPQLPLPVVSEASSLTGTACSFSRVQAPALTSAWPLPSTSATSFQTLMGGAYLCQYSSTTLWAGGAAHSQISTSAASYSSVWEWDMGGDNTVTITDQGAVISSSVLTCQYTTCAHGNALVPPYPSLPASLVQETPAHIVNQGYILPLPCWEGNQGYCYDPHSLGLLFSGELGPCLPSHGAESSMGTKTELEPKDVQLREVSPPFSTSGVCYYETADPPAVINVQGGGHNSRMEPSHPHIISSRRSRVRQELQEDLKESVIDPTCQGKCMGSINATLPPKNSSVTNTLTVLVGKNKHKALEVVGEASKAKVQLQNPECLMEEVVVCTASGKDIANRSKLATNKLPKAPFRRANKTKIQGKEKSKGTRENNPKNGGIKTYSGTEMKTEVKTRIVKEKNKRNYPEPCQQIVKKPRSNLAMHMMESVQVFHALGEKSGKKPGLTSFRAMGNVSNYEETKFSPAIQSRLDSESPKKVLGKKTKRSAENQCPSQCQGELLPPGKVRLVPLPFLSPQKPRVRPLSHRPQSLASRRHIAADPAQPPNTAQPTPLIAHQPVNDSSCLRAPIKPSQPISTKATLQGLTNPPQSSVSQFAVARPATHKASCFTALQHKPVSTAATKRRSPPKPPNQYLLQDFSFQPIPWRKPDIPGPAVSDPISKEQRPEREAMKRRAQQEREKAAQNTFVGQLQFFHQRQTDMEISQYYGYVKPRVRPLSRRPQSLASHRPTVADPAQFPSNTAQPTPLNASQPAHDSSCLRARTKQPQPISTHAILWGRNNPPQSSVSQLAVARPAPHKP